MIAPDSALLAPIEDVPSGAPGRSWGDRLAPLFANKLAVLGGVLTLGFLIIAGIGAALLIHQPWHDLYLNQNLRRTLLAPGEKGTLLGTDNLGRDMVWRLFAGTAGSLWAGLAVTVLSMSFGLVMGAHAGYAGGWTDRVISALIDLTWGFPVILVAVIFVGMLEPGLKA